MREWQSQSHVRWYCKYHKGPMDIFSFLLSQLPNRWQPKGASLFENFLLGLTSFHNYGVSLRPTYELILVREV